MEQYYILTKSIFFLPYGSRYYKGTGLKPEYTEGMPKMYKIEGSNDLIDADVVEAPHNADYFQRINPDGSTNKPLPNEGTLKPHKFTILSHALEAGDTWNFHAPCTLTFIRQKPHKEGLALTFEVSDLKSNNK